MLNQHDNKWDYIVAIHMRLFNGYLLFHGLQSCCWVFFLLFSPPSGRSTEKFTDSKWKRLKPGKVYPSRPVPSHIPKPPYVKSKKPPGIASGPEIHDEKGIECMRASGKLAAQVLQYAGTLVKVHFCTFHLCISVFSLLLQISSVFRGC